MSIIKSDPIMSFRAGYDSPGGAGEHHAHVMAYDDGVRAADRWLRDQQPKLYLRHSKKDEKLRDQYSNGRIGEKGSSLRQHLRQGLRQVQGPWPHTGARLPCCGSSHRRVLCQSRMQDHGCADGGKVQLFHPGGTQGMDRPVDEDTANDPSSRQGRVYGRGQEDQAALRNEIALAVSQLKSDGLHLVSPQLQPIEFYDRLLGETSWFWH